MPLGMAASKRIFTPATPAGLMSTSLGPTTMVWNPLAGSCFLAMAAASMRSQVNTLVASSG